MALKVLKATHVGKPARDKSKERNRVSELPKSRVRVEGDISPALFFQGLTVYKDKTVESVIVPKFSVPKVIEDIFAGLYIDSNYRIMFSSTEVGRYENCIGELLSIYVEIDSARYKLVREKGIKSYVPLFIRVDKNDREFLAIINPLFGVVVYDEKIVLVRRDKKQSRYSVRLENILKKYKTGRVDFKLNSLVYELGASSVYAKSFGQFDGRVLVEAVETINNNDRGVYIKDYGSINNEIVWFEIEKS